MSTITLSIGRDCQGRPLDPGAKRAIQQVLREQEVEVLNEAERLEAEAEALRAEAHRLRVERLGLGPSSHEEADDAAAHRARFDID